MSSDPMKFVRKGFSLCTIKSNEELLNPASHTRSTRFVEVDLASDPNLT